ncbi:hypothetical protein ONS96_002297 [Cadophora gregata f. sp. sojae]|nr:hypothetical protein ONS96_002297 [Cadophora gregata f. sp. sojae]
MLHLHGWAGPDHPHPRYSTVPPNSDQIRIQIQIQIQIRAAGPWAAPRGRRSCLWSTGAQARTAQRCVFTRGGSQVGFSMQPDGESDPLSANGDALLSSSTIANYH